MDGVLQVAALLLALGGPPPPDPASLYGYGSFGHAGEPPPGAIFLRAAELQHTQMSRNRIAKPGPGAADSWTSEDKFRHFAASWAAMVFTYSTARAVHDDPDTAIAIALPVTGAFGIAKEVADRRRGGPFSFRDLTADALGAGVAWLFLREVR